MAKNTVKDEFIVALDIGTTKVLCLVADYDEDGELRLVGIGQEAVSYTHLTLPTILLV